MGEKDSLKKILTWAGIIAAISIPVYLLLKKIEPLRDNPEGEFEADIFSRDLK